MRSTIIKKTSQDEKQNQSTKTTNINYIQNFMSIKKNLQKLKKPSDKFETEQNNLSFTKKDMVQLYKKAR